MSYAELALSVEAFRKDAEEILGFSESSIHRTALLTESYKKIDNLSVIQADMLRQALRCVEVGVFRAAHVLAWAALTDFLQSMADYDGYAALNAKYPT